MVKFTTDATDTVVTSLDGEMGIEPTVEIDEAFLTEATSYTIEIDRDGNEIRLQFENDTGVLSQFTADGAGVYDLAQTLLRAYDKLEGLSP